MIRGAIDASRFDLLHDSIRCPAPHYTVVFPLALAVLFIRVAMPEHEPEDDDVQLSMLENGLDFIASGLKHIASPISKFDLKYAVLHLSAGIELVLKDRL